MHVYTSCYGIGVQSGQEKVTNGSDFSKWTEEIKGNSSLSLCLEKWLIKQYWNNCRKETESFSHMCLSPLHYPPLCVYVCVSARVHQRPLSALRVGPCVSGVTHASCQRWWGGRPSGASCHRVLLPHVRTDRTSQLHPDVLLLLLLTSF